MSKLVKNFKTAAESAGLPSVKEIEKQIAKVKGERPKKIEKPASGAEPQIIYVQMPPPKKERKKRELTDDQKNALRERLVKARATKMEKKAAN